MKVIIKLKIAYQANFEINHSTSNFFIKLIIFILKYYFGKNLNL